MLHIWSKLVDAQYSSNKVFKCHRGEISPNASSARRCQQTEETDRKKVGKRADILIRKGDIEYAYGEASLNSAADDKKNLFDSKLKTMKSMKDMLHFQLKTVNNTSTVKFHIRSVGYQFSKFAITILYMDFVGNICCRVRKSKPITFRCG